MIHFVINFLHVRGRLQHFFSQGSCEVRGGLGVIERVTLKRVDRCEGACVTTQMVGNTMVNRKRSNRPRFSPKSKPNAHMHPSSEKYKPSARVPVSESFPQGKLPMADRVSACLRSLHHTEKQAWVTCVGTAQPHIIKQNNSSRASNYFKIKTTHNTYAWMRRLMRVQNSVRVLSPAARCLVKWLNRPTNWNTGYQYIGDDFPMQLW